MYKDFKEIINDLKENIPVAISFLFIGIFLSWFFIDKTLIQSAKNEIFSLKAHAQRMEKDHTSKIEMEVQRHSNEIESKDQKHSFILIQAKRDVDDLKMKVTILRLSNIQLSEENSELKSKIVFFEKKCNNLIWQ